MNDPPPDSSAPMANGDEQEALHVQVQEQEKRSTPQIPEIAADACVTLDDPPPDSSVPMENRDVQQALNLQVQDQEGSNMAQIPEIAAGAGQSRHLVDGPPQLPVRNPPREQPPKRKQTITQGPSHTRKVYLLNPAAPKFAFMFQEPANHVSSNEPSPLLAKLKEPMAKLAICIDKAGEYPPTVHSKTEGNFVLIPLCSSIGPPNPDFFKRHMNLVREQVPIPRPEMVLNRRNTPLPPYTRDPAQRMDPNEVQPSLVSEKDQDMDQVEPVDPPHNDVEDPEKSQAEPMQVEQDIPPEEQQINREEPRPNAVDEPRQIPQVVRAPNSLVAPLPNPVRASQPVLPQNRLGAQNLNQIGVQQQNGHGAPRPNFHGAPQPNPLGMPLGPGGYHQNYRGAPSPNFLPALQQNFPGAPHTFPPGMQQGPGAYRPNYRGAPYPNFLPAPHQNFPGASQQNMYSPGAPVHQLGAQQGMMAQAQQNPWAANNNPLRVPQPNYLGAQNIHIPGVSQQRYMPNPNAHLIDNAPPLLNDGVPRPGPSGPYASHGYVIPGGMNPAPHAYPPSLNDPPQPSGNMCKGSSSEYAVCEDCKYAQLLLQLEVRSCPRCSNPRLMAPPKQGQRFVRLSCCNKEMVSSPDRLKVVKCSRCQKDSEISQFSQSYNGVNVYLSIPYVEKEARNVVGEITKLNAAEQQQLDGELKKWKDTVQKEKDDFDKKFEETHGWR